MRCQHDGSNIKAPKQSQSSLSVSHLHYLDIHYTDVIVTGTIYPVFLLRCLHRISQTIRNTTRRRHGRVNGNRWLLL